MPFKSEKQRKFMYSQHPEIAKRWSDEMSAPDKNKGGKIVGKSDKDAHRRLKDAMERRMKKNRKVTFK